MHPTDCETAENRFSVQCYIRARKAHDAMIAMFNHEQPLRPGQKSRRQREEYSDTVRRSKAFRRRQFAAREMNPRRPANMPMTQKLTRRAETSSKRCAVGRQARESRYVLYRPTRIPKQQIVLGWGDAIFAPDSTISRA